MIRGPAHKVNAAMGKQTHNSNTWSSVAAPRRRLLSRRTCLAMFTGRLGMVAYSSYACNDDLILVICGSMFQAAIGAAGARWPLVTDSGWREPARAPAFCAHFRV